MLKKLINKLKKAYLSQIHLIKIIRDAYLEILN
jgi:hypothetical protein